MAMACKLSMVWNDTGKFVFILRSGIMKIIERAPSLLILRRSSLTQKLDKDEARQFHCRRILLRTASHIVFGQKAAKHDAGQTISDKIPSLRMFKKPSDRWYRVENFAKTNTGQVRFVRSLEFTVGTDLEKTADNRVSHIVAEIKHDNGVWIIGPNDFLIGNELLSRAKPGDVEVEDFKFALFRRAI